PDLVGHYDLPPSPADFLRAAVLAGAAHAVGAARDLQDVPLPGQASAVVLQPLPARLVTVGGLGGGVGHVEGGVAVPLAGGAVLGRADGAAVEAAAVVVVAGDVGEVRGQSGVRLEGAAGGVADVLPAQLPADPVGRLRLRVVGQDVLGALNQVRFLTLRVHL